MAAQGRMSWKIEGLETGADDYMTKPFDVFREVARVLKPGGLFLVIFIVALPEGIFHYIQRKYHQFERWVEVD